MNVVEKNKDKDVKESDGEVQLAIFLIGKDEYAIDIMKIMEIIRPQKITSVPESHEFIEGVINLRGKVIPIIDLRMRLGNPDKRDNTTKEDLSRKEILRDLRERIIIINRDGRTTGLIVDSVTEVIRLPKKEIDPLPDTVGEGSSQYLSGVAKSGEKLIPILNIDRIVGI